MFRNYLKTAIRNLWLYKGFALINIGSLTIGIVGCMAIILFVWDEQQYDRFLPGQENIYRIYDQVTTQLASAPLLSGARATLALCRQHAIPLQI
jgi:putative ABC transport system permease protein